jgi:hypothetical protein
MCLVFFVCVGIAISVVNICKLERGGETFELMFKMCYANKNPPYLVEMKLQALHINLRTELRSKFDFGSRLGMGSLFANLPCNRSRCTCPKEYKRFIHKGLSNSKTQR